MDDAETPYDIIPPPLPPFSPSSLEWAILALVLLLLVVLSRWLGKPVQKAEPDPHELALSMIEQAASKPLCRESLALISRCARTILSGALHTEVADMSDTELRKTITSGSEPCVVSAVEALCAVEFIRYSPDISAVPVQQLVAALRDVMEKCFRGAGK